MIKTGFLITSSLLLFGCAAKEKIITQEVVIIKECDAKIPARPSDTGSITLNNANIIEYTLELEKIAYYCTGEK